ncbi:MAG TPA: hypothetical protein VKE69_13200, partial [Planctomycetota bacterium]|nr:hypothetical protein [Planctomycetota bacterium]
MTAHDERHDDLVREVVLGDRSAADLPDCETCRREVAELHAVAGQLDATGAKRREVEREAARLTRVPGEAHVEESIRRLRETPSWKEARRRRVVPWPAILVA